MINIEILKYETRDGNGNDIVKDIEIKDFEVKAVDCNCSICGKHCYEAVPVKKAVSSAFTDWAYVGEYVCKECSKYFSLYKFSYIIDDSGIRLLNVRQVRDEIIKEQKPPFKFVITKSQKKHLFYDAPMNYSSERFAVKLERETIYTTLERQRTLFTFVEGLQALGATKAGMAEGELPLDVLQQVGYKALVFLKSELANSREIQIPLFCGKKQEMNEEEVLCNLDLILKAK